jgi:hypothetical protein
VGQIGVPNGAEVGDIDVVIQRCPEQPLTLAGSKLSAIDGQDGFFRYGSLQNSVYVTLLALASRAIMTIVRRKSVHSTITTSSIVTELIVTVQQRS